MLNQIAKISLFTGLLTSISGIANANSEADISLPICFQTTSEEAPPVANPSDKIVSIAQDNDNPLDLIDNPNRTMIVVYEYDISMRNNNPDRIYSLTPRFKHFGAAFSSNDIVDSVQAASTGDGYQSRSLQLSPAIMNMPGEEAEYYTLSIMVGDWMGGYHMKKISCNIQLVE